ncbi:hypothetical protein [Saccharopolyspora hattusasensis]|uniref:hypothetical protein n=1 Tax=Saccharopolyspora hattusasensis TaxID=1128679 RepID=UPI003D95768A
MPDRQTDASGGARVRDVVHDVVAEVASDELPLVAGLARSDDATVVRRLSRWGQRREPLGFGLAEIAAMVTPVVWLAVDEVAQRLAGAAVDGAAKGAKGLLGKIFRRKKTPAVVPPLAPEQLAEVRQRVLELAAQRGLEPEHAITIADAVVARLALPRGPAQGPTDPDASTPAQG